MRKIRIGNDISVSWEVKTSGEAQSLESRPLRLFVRSAYRRDEITDFSVDGAVISFVYGATMQKHIGAYCVELQDETEGQKRTICADLAFTLVAHSSEEDSDDVEFGVYLVELKSNIVVARPGQSAYEAWLGQGHTGTEADFIAWLREPAETAASKVDETLALVGKTVALTQEEYDALVAAGTVDANTYYNILEEE